MKNYQCINCGKSKVDEIQCSCPSCGYRMFEAPFEKKEVLISEIERFIFGLQVKAITRDMLAFDGKEKDDSRFPSYEKIVKYVSERERTEDFLNNLLETVVQLKLHFTEQFSKLYPVSFEVVDNLISEHERCLASAYKIVFAEVKYDLQPVQWPDASLYYTEVPDRYLWFSASELVDDIEKLAKKIEKFIKINNLYGTIHKYRPSNHCKTIDENTDFKDTFENDIFDTEVILNKKYSLDIEDDGRHELTEMLTCLWHNIESIMAAPLLIQSYSYVVNTNTLNESDFLSQISMLLQSHYKSLNDSVNIRAELSAKTEVELFKIYDELINIDKFGILVPGSFKSQKCGPGEKKLNELIGLTEIKESVKKIKAYALANKNSNDLNIHMCFMGNPGSGKTEVARLIADILYENGILPTNRFVEVDRSGLVSEYFGATAEKTRKVIASAMGGVLFVDEAYSLGNNSDSSITDYGKEAIDTLIKAMEDNRGKFCVIFAGYKNEMQKMLSLNPGFKSRIQFILDFPNYSRDELKQIFEIMLGKRKYIIGDEALNRILDITDIKRKKPNFANAREVRNILDQVIMCQNLRVVGPENKELAMIDVNKYIKDAKIKLPTSSSDTSSVILTGEEELSQLIGLDSVKKMILKIKAYAKRNKDQYDFNLHMCFYGNPGTGKTEVARILSRILYDAGVLTEAKLVETDSRGLLGKFVGETAPKTEAKINEALNGVLFIDEAYGLMSSTAINGNATSYGEEAITVLLKEMEDKRGQFCTILAGYKEEMQNLLRANPGFESRIQFKLEFPDYSREELGNIAESFLAKKKYKIENNALERFLDIVDYYRNLPNFANARTVRNILDKVIMNQNLRTEDSFNDELITIDDVNDYLNDEKIDLTKQSNRGQHIGFV